MENSILLGLQTTVCFKQLAVMSFNDDVVCHRMLFRS